MRVSPININVTRDLTIFNNQTGNRAVLGKDVEKIEAKILEDNLLRYHPLLVNGDLIVIDGQHRLEVAKRNNLEVSFIIMPDAEGLHTTQKINTTGKKWQTKDFLQSFCAIGNPNYLMFRDVLREYEFLTISSFIAFVCPGKKKEGISGTAEFNNGNLRKDKIERLIPILERLKLYKEVPQVYKNTIFHAFLVAADKHNIIFNDSRLITKIKCNSVKFEFIPRSIYPLSELIGKVYNYKLGDKNIVDFNLKEIK